VCVESPLLALSWQAGNVSPGSAFSGNTRPKMVAVTYSVDDPEQMAEEYSLSKSVPHEQDVGSWLCAEVAQDGPGGFPQLPRRPDLV
jgi:hypothetical protein